MKSATAPGRDGRAWFQSGSSVATQRAVDSPAREFGPGTESDPVTRLLRDPWCRLLGVIQSNVFQASTSWFARRGLGTLNFPVTSNIVSCPSGIGSDSSPVAIRLWGRDTYLTDSNQFFLEMACRLFGRGAYSIVPCFRGDAPDNSHLSQFYQAEAEIPGGVDDAIWLAEAYLRELAAAALTGCEDLLEQLEIDTEHVRQFATGTSAIPRMALDQACDVLGNHFVHIDNDGGCRTLTREGEMLLMQQYGGALWLTDMEYLSVPFYQAATDATMRTARTADLLMGLGEVVGLGERHLTADDVRASLILRGLDPGDYAWYLQMRRDAPLRTAGFGVGLERFYGWLLGHPNIRDYQLFPRLRGARAAF